MILSVRQRKFIEIGLVILLIAVGAFLRLYRLKETLIFQGDQGRDALVVEQIIKQGNFTLLGPVTSVGNMYLGPFYYYFMAPFLALTYPNPIGPAYGVAAANIILLIVIYFMAREMFGRLAALISLGIYSLMIPAISLSRFSWNPNLAPLVSALIIWGLYRFYQNQDTTKLIWVGLGLGILAQLHYLAMILLGVVITVFILAFKQKHRSKQKLFQAAGWAMLVFLITWLPLVIFNFRHQNLIINSFKTFVTSGEHHLFPGGSIYLTLRETEAKSIRLLGHTMIYGNNLTDRIATYLAIGILLVLGLTSKGKIFKDKGGQIILLTIGFSILGISVYSGNIFDHYLGFALPALALFWGFLLARVWRLNKIAGPVITGIILLLFLKAVLPHAPTWAAAGPSLSRYQTVANDIAAQIGPGKYNLTLLSESNDNQGMNYRYFLTTTAHPPANADDYNNLDKLVIIDELGVADPLAIKRFEVQEPNLKYLINEFNSLPEVQVYIFGEKPLSNKPQN